MQKEKGIHIPKIAWNEGVRKDLISKHLSESIPKSSKVEEKVHVTNLNLFGIKA